MLICSYASVTNDWAKWCALLWSAKTSCQFHQKFHVTRKKIELLQPNFYKALKPPFWLCNWVSIARLVALFPQMSRLLPAVTSSLLAANLNYVEYCLCLCLPIWPDKGPKLCQRMAPRALPLIMQSKHSIVFWNSPGLLEWLPASRDDLQGPELGTQLQPDQWIVMVYLLWSPGINCVEFEFF